MISRAPSERRRPSQSRKRFISFRATSDDGDTTWRLLVETTEQEIWAGTGTGNATKIIIHSPLVLSAFHQPQSHSLTCTFRFILVDLAHHCRSLSFFPIALTLFLFLRSVNYFIESDRGKDSQTSRACLQHWYVFQHPRYDTMRCDCYSKRLYAPPYPRRNCCIASDEHSLLKNYC
jgi:hypothetical protein